MEHHTFSHATTLEIRLINLHNVVLGLDPDSTDLNDLISVIYPDWSQNPRLGHLKHPFNQFKSLSLSLMQPKEHNLSRAVMQTFSSGFLHSLKSIIELRLDFGQPNLNIKHQANLPAALGLGLIFYI